jgi:RHS repeat-associated protein
VGIGLLFGLLSSVEAADAPPAMVLPGQMNVTATGAFTYTIPIAVPPGTAGMVPALSLDYSSQNGDGLEGLGWVVSGLPSISRCAKTLDPDGVHGGVNYDAGANGDATNDRFCMEGQRLILINGGSGGHGYGQDGAEYRTEIEGFSRIISYGSAGNGPSYFKVWTKSGQIMEFGNSADSQVLVAKADGSGNTTTARSWGVYKISDTKGNYLKVIYNSPTSDERTKYGEAYPIEIDYTGTSAFSPYNSVKLVYGYSRNDITPGYQAGGITETTKLLSEIQTYSRNGSGAQSLVSDYKLTYDMAAATTAQHDELKDIQLCDASSNCLPSTHFTWQGTRDVVAFTQIGDGIGQGGTHTKPNNRGAEFNGDGLIDAMVLAQEHVCSQGDTSSVWNGVGDVNGSFVQSHMTKTINDHSNSYNCSGTYPASFQNQYTTLFDYDGDGLTDVAENDHDFTQYKFLFHNEGNGNFLEKKYIFRAAIFDDFDGDGRADYVSLDNDHVMRSQGADNDFLQGPSVSAITGAGYFASGDFDGDGCADIFTQKDDQTTRATYVCNLISGTTPNHIDVPDWLGSSEGYKITLGDFNGDGKTDVLRTGGNDYPEIFFSTGTALVPLDQSVWGNGLQYWNDWLITAGDFNGDGRADLALIAPNGSINEQPPQHHIYLSTGQGFVLADSIDFHSGDTNVRAIAGDLNNDGATDLWIQEPSGDTKYLMTYTPELIHLVTNGIGVTTTVNYDHLSNPAVYTKGTGAAYPTQDLAGPLYVVRQIDSSTGLGSGIYTSTYAYAGLKANVRGRGVLGFSQVIITDPQTHVVQTTNYLTDFPFTGLIASQTKICVAYCLASDVPLSSTTNCYKLSVTDCDNSTIAPTPISLVTNGGTRYFIPLRRTVVSGSDTDNANSKLPTATTTYVYDCDTLGACDATSPTGFGDATQITVVTAMPPDGSDSSTKITTNHYTYLVDGTNWLLGRLTSSSVESIVGSLDVTRTSSFTYDLGSNPSGLLLNETVEPNDASSACLYLDTLHGYDPFGNTQTATTQGAPSTSCGAARTTTTLYATDGSSNFGQFATTIKNALPSPQSETWDYISNSDSGRFFGVPLSHTGPNGLTTSWQYDSFGRKTLETAPDGTKTQIAYYYCQPTCANLPSAESKPTNAAFFKVVTPQATDGSQDGPKSVTFYDSLSRVIAADVQGFNNGWIRVATIYDAFGRISKTSRPYFLSGGTALYTVNSYINTVTVKNDPLGRVQKVTPPGSNGFVKTYYQGLTTQVTNPNNQVTTTTKNARGLVASVKDALNTVTYYTYDAEGNLCFISNSAGGLCSSTPTGNQIKHVYDLRGRKTDSYDPDMGHWTYAYDAFGELVQQTDAKGQVTALTYDILGRLKHREEPSSTGTLSSNWIYNDTVNYTSSSDRDVGQLIQACFRAGTGTDCSGLVTSDYLRELTYDDKGRPKTVKLTIDATAYTYQTDYDGTTGRVSDVIRPSGLQIDNYYTSLGYLSQEKDHATGTAYWAANARDQEMHLIQSTAGNGVVTYQGFDQNTGLVLNIHAGPSDSVANFSYTWDKLGNLLTRQDMLAGAGGGLTETSCYDALNRLTKYSITSGGETCSTGDDKKTITYDTLGNITKKSDVSTAGGYHYGSGAGPHALTSIVSCTTNCMLVNGVSNPTFVYDANGNMTCEYGSLQVCGVTAPRSITWTSFNMVDKITQGVLPGGLQFAYDDGHARIKMCLPNCLTPASTTNYLNGMGQMEEKVVTATSTTWRDYIQADGKIVAERFDAGGTVTLSYFVTDHLGSIAVVTDSTACTATCNVTERDAYDAWGKRRNWSDWSDDTTCALTSSTTRGFTGHEELDTLCLINANARIYDATVGRFMSPDPSTEAVYNLQDLNRYSYVGNNPLSLTDPTGLCFLGCFWHTAQFREALGLAVAILLEQPWALEALEGPAFAGSSLGYIAGFDRQIVAARHAPDVIKFSEQGSFSIVSCTSPSASNRVPSRWRAETRAVRRHCARLASPALR